MKHSRIGIFFGIFSGFLAAQTIFTLSGIKAYDPIVVNLSSRIDKSFESQLKTLMVETSQTLGIDISRHTSCVLALMLHDISLGETVGVQLELTIGEYFVRLETNQTVFAITYQESSLIEVSPNKDEFEEALSDSSEEMLKRFALQYKEENQLSTKHTKEIKHEAFALSMEYETDYRTAIEKAKKQKKQLMIFMSANFCPWCRKLENHLLSQPQVDKKIKAKMIPLMLNLSEKKFPKQFEKINMTPTLYIVDPQTEHIVEQFVGYNNKEMFLQYLK